MTDAGTRIEIPGGLFSVDSFGIWALQPPVKTPLPDSFLKHSSSEIVLAVRGLRAFVSTSGTVDDAPAFERAVDRYFDGQWAGRRSVEYWRVGSLRGATGFFDEAMREAVIREWLVTDGRHLADIATFATYLQWNEVLADCEAIVRSVRFDSG